MGGDRPLQDRMNYRSGQVAKDRQEIRDAAAGKPKKVPIKFIQIYSRSQMKEKQTQTLVLSAT